MGQNLERLVFQPPQPSYSRDRNLVWLTTSQDQVIPAFYIDRSRDYNATHTLLFSHGNAEDLGLIIRSFRQISIQLKVNIFAYEYSGYGMSTPGGPSETNLYSDIEAAFKYVRDVIGQDWSKIIPYGRSIGTVPSVHLATRTAVRGVILQSPMLSILRIPFRFRFTLPGDMCPNIDKIGNVRAPVFIIHGTRDEIVPCWHGQRLYEKCVDTGSIYDAYIIEGGDHNNLEVFAGEAFFERMSRFLQHLSETQPDDRLVEQARNSQI